MVILLVSSIQEKQEKDYNMKTRSGNGTKIHQRKGLVLALGEALQPLRPRILSCPYSS